MYICSLVFTAGVTQVMVFLVFTSCSAKCLSLQNFVRNTLKTQYKNS